MQQIEWNQVNEIGLMKLVNKTMRMQANKCYQVNATKWMRHANAASEYNQVNATKWMQLNECNQVNATKWLSEHNQAKTKWMQPSEC